MELEDRSEADRIRGRRSLIAAGFLLKFALEVDE